MNDPLSADQLLTHVEWLAQHIGPRPAGSPAEQQARNYVRRVLYDAGFASAQIEEFSFPATDTWGHLFFAAIGLTALGNVLALAGPIGKFIGGAAALFSGYHLRQSFTSAKQPLSALYLKGTSSDLVTRILAEGEPRRRVVLIGHTDTNKARVTFSPWFKRFLPLSLTLGITLPLINGVALLAEANGLKRAKIVRQLSLWNLLAFLPILLWDEKGDYVDGANDNATAVACLLGLAAHLKQHPLSHTEVWLAFTGAEEAGGLGTHALLDRYERELRDAWFIDFEMVGTHKVAYLTQHGVSPLTRYKPDADLVALARQASMWHPDLGVMGCPLTIVEEVGALQARGYRGICLAGIGADGWLANWHQASDNLANIEPSGIERAARFALAMMQMLDERTTLPG